jgi:hypothetical protein
MPQNHFGALDGARFEGAKVTSTTRRSAARNCRAVPARRIATQRSGHSVGARPGQSSNFSSRRTNPMRYRVAAPRRKVPDRAAGRSGRVCETLVRDGLERHASTRREEPVACLEIVCVGLGAHLLGCVRGHGNARTPAETMPSYKSYASWCSQLCNITFMFGPRSDPTCSNWARESVRPVASETRPVPVAYDRRPPHPHPASSSRKPRSPLADAAGAPARSRWRGELRLLRAGQTGHTVISGREPVPLPWQNMSASYRDTARRTEY